MPSSVASAEKLRKMEEINITQNADIPSTSANISLSVPTTMADVANSISHTLDTNNVTNIQTSALNHQIIQADVHQERINIPRQEVQNIIQEINIPVTTNAQRTRSLQTGGHVGHVLVDGNQQTLLSNHQGLYPNQPTYVIPSVIQKPVLIQECNIPQYSPLQPPQKRWRPVEDDGQRRFLDWQRLNQDKLYQEFLHEQGGQYVSVFDVTHEIQPQQKLLYIFS